VRNVTNPENPAPTRDYGRSSPFACPPTAELGPLGLGVALTGTVEGGFTGLLWGGAVRVFLLHHATLSINSLEAWHNNRHAFPTSARHGLGRRQLDPSAWLNTGLERCHLAWDVIRISPARQQAKRGPAAA